MSGNPTILSSRVRLARNYQDLPFDVAGKPDCAAMCVARTAGALKLSGNDEGFELLHLKDMGRLLYNAMKTLAMVYSLIAAAGAFGWMLAYLRIPAKFTELLLNISDNKVVVFLIINVILLLLGCIMDMAPLILIMTPILLPVAAQYGIDPIQFALVMVITLVYAGVTPPVGGVLFITIGIAEVKLKDTLRYLMPYLAAVFIVVLLCIFVPQVSTFLPNLLFG